MRGGHSLGLNGRLPWSRSQEDRVDDVRTTVVLMRRDREGVAEVGVIDVPFHPAIHGRTVRAWTTALRAREDALARNAIVVTVDERTHLVVLRSPNGPPAGQQVNLSDLL